MWAVCDLQWIYTPSAGVRAVPAAQQPPLPTLTLLFPNTDSCAPAPVESPLSSCSLLLSHFCQADFVGAVSWLTFGQCVSSQTGSGMDWFISSPPSWAGSLGMQAVEGWASCEPLGKPLQGNQLSWIWGGHLLLAVTQLHAPLTACLEKPRCLLSSWVTPQMWKMSSSPGPDSSLDKDKEWGFIMRFLKCNIGTSIFLAA